MEIGRTLPPQGLGDVGIPHSVKSDGELEATHTGGSAWGVLLQKGSIFLAGFHEFEVTWFDFAPASSISIYGRLIIALTNLSFLSLINVAGHEYRF